MHACTIVARNYLAQARVFARSFRRFHRDCRVTILVIDDASDQTEQHASEGVDLLNLSHIGLDPGDEYRMPMIYNVTELSTAVKPWLLRHLRESSGSDAVVYFDPDIEVFAPLYDIGELARSHSIVLTPHVTEPIPRDKLSLTESDILGAGIYNLGFVATGPGSEPFLLWWSERLRRECVIDPPRMRFTDQRWVDFVPGLFPHYILRDRTCNVAYWNLYSRDVRWTGERYEVDGDPLRFFHFSGYDPDKPYLLSKHQGERPRVRLSEHPGVARICSEYSSKLLAEGFNVSKKHPYGFGQTESGIKVDFYIHGMYRRALLQFEEGLAPEPPTPFGPDGDGAFLRWLNEPQRRDRPIITRYMMGIHAARPDLQNAFPDPLGARAEAFSEWFLHDGSKALAADERLIPGRPEAAVADGSDSAATDAPRVNVVGYLAAELGVGEAARLLITALEASGTSYNAIINRETLSRQQHSFRCDEEAAGESDINIICVNADQTPAFAAKAGPKFFDGRYSIGLWFWEIEDFPAMYHSALNHVDEVWAASPFVRDAIAKASAKPVFKFPLPIVKPEIDPSLTRDNLGMPGRFTFLFSFDFLSVLARKNPLGLIDAFRTAFRPGEGPALLIKTINGDKKLLDLEKLHFAAGGHPDIYIRDGYLRQIEKNTLTSLCDCYVSLHRSEGYGLTMAEAMALSKPVIATGYSGNMDFMTDENSYLCPFSYGAIGAGSYPYPEDSRWAEPDLEVAAKLMRRVWEHHDEAAERGARAATDVHTRHSPAVAGAAIRARIDHIRTRRVRPRAIPRFEEFFNELQQAQSRAANGVTRTQAV